MPKTTTVSFVFVNPSEDGVATGKGKITITVESESECPHDIINESDFEQEVEAFFQNQFCVEGGRVVSTNIADALGKA